MSSRGKLFYYLVNLIMEKQKTCKVMKSNIVGGIFFQ
jgi:hypothetical protein